MPSKEEVYEVEAVREAQVKQKHKRTGKITWEYRVKWKGYPEEENTWEPDRNLKHASRAVKDFWSLIDLGGRSITDAAAFQLDELFVAVQDKGDNNSDEEASYKPEEENDDGDDDNESTKPTPSTSTRVTRMTRTSSRNNSKATPSARTLRKRDGQTKSSRPRSSSSELAEPPKEEEERASPSEEPEEERERPTVQSPPPRSARLPPAKAEKYVQATPARKRGRGAESSASNGKKRAVEDSSAEDDDEEEEKDTKPIKSASRISKRNSSPEFETVTQPRARNIKKKSRSPPRHRAVRRIISDEEDSDDEPLAPLKPKHRTPAKKDVKEESGSASAPGTPTKPKVQTKKTPARRMIIDPSDEEEAALVSALIPSTRSHLPGILKRKIPPSASKDSTPYVDDSEEEETARKKKRLDDAMATPGDASPKWDDNAPLFSDDDDVNEEKPKPARDINSIPAHRARKANPRVKMMDDGVHNEVFSSAIPIKRRIASSSKVGTTQSSTSGNPPPPSMPPPRDIASPQRDSSFGSPPKSPSRLPNRARNSVLNFAKGLTSPFRSTTATSKDTRSGTSQSHEEPGDDGMDVDTQTVEDPPPPPPTSKELMDLAGFDQAAAEELPDFVADEEEGGPKDTPEDAPEDTLPVNEESPSLPTPSTSAPAHPPARPSLFSASSWGLSSIFGSVAPGGGPKVSEASELPMNSTFTLSVDSSTNIPLILKDVHPATSPLAVGLPASYPRLDNVFAESRGGPPGRLYTGDTVRKILSTFSTGGSSGRFVLDAKATEQQKEQFERLRMVLNGGDVFVALAGTATIVLCCAEAVDIARRLDVAPALIGMAETVLAVHVVIEDHLAFANVALE